MAIQSLGQSLAPSLDDGAAEREAKIAKLREGLAQSPDDLFLNRWLIELQPRPQTGGLADEYRDRLAKHKDDFDLGYLAARALVGKDTPAAIESLQKMIVQAPEFPWTHLALTEIYSSAAFSNPAKVAENLRAFHRTCPANLEAFEHLNIVEDSSALRELAAALRAQLQNTSGPRELRYYPILWAAEFRLTPPSDLERARKIVADDLKRIEPLSKDNDRSVLGVLSEGYRLSDQQEAEKRTQARLDAARPRDPAFEAYQSWAKDHPQGSTQAAYQEREDALYRASASWIERWPDNRFCWEKRREALIGTRSHSAEDWKQVADGLLRTGRDRDLPFLRHRIAEDWVGANVMVREALDMLRDLWDWSETDPPPASDLIRRTISDDLDNSSRAKFRFAILVTQAEGAIELKDFDLAHATLGKLSKWLETEYPKYYDQDPMYFPDREGRYVTLMGRLAEAEGHKLDALAYYHQLISNPWYMREYGGVAKSARNLFKELGGSDEAWAAWSKVAPWPAGSPDPPRGWPLMAWNSLRRVLPEMQVPDAAGRTWTLADFKGKTTFVFLWATWCGPCRQELPGMQKLYEAVKGRSDVQAIGLSIDENPAIVEHFMKDRKLSFPVLVSKSYAERILPEVALGQTWLVDATASVRLQRQNVPYIEQVWVDEALDKLNHPPQ